MKVILPVAGKGTRLLPVTRHVPKPLVRVAGRAVLDYVLDALRGLDVEELIFITGHLKEPIEAYVREVSTIPARFVEQEVQDGTAGAVDRARPYVDGPVLIVFVDTVFDADLTLIDRSDADGIVWAKEVEDYQRFGVVVTDSRGYMQRIVEKPREPISKLANIGLYYIRDWQTLYAGIEQTLAGPQLKGEWYLTDALQYMIDHEKRLYTAAVAGWYDCGKLETLLETQLHLLRQGRARDVAVPDGVTIEAPVHLADDVRLEGCTIGPNVAIDRGTVLQGCTVRDAIIGAGTRLVDCSIARALVGDGVTLRGQELRDVIAAPDEVAPAP